MATFNYQMKSYLVIIFYNYKLVDWQEQDIVDSRLHPRGVESKLKVGGQIVVQSAEKILRPPLLFWAPSPPPL